jgi:malonyl-CoA/methylmalonyl-CoA synthetase
VTLPELFERSFAGRSGDRALEFRGQTFTFADIDSRATRTAQLLAARGLSAGDRLAVYLENRVEFIDLFLACTRLGVIFVPINILYRDREVSHIVGDAEPKAIVASGTVPGGFAFWHVDELRGLTPKSGGVIPIASPSANPLDGSTPAAIVYTSGTTGTAKGAILTHGNFAANATALVDAWRISAADRFLLPLPLFHVHGLGNGLCCWLASGCEMRLLERFDIVKAAGEFQSFRPTLFFGVPTIYVRLLTLPEEIASGIGRGMRLFVSGSAPLSAAVFEAFQAKFGHAILERYGMTETMMNASNPYEGDRRPGTVGPALPGVDVRVARPDGRDTGPDEEGQVLVRGPNVFAGYWRRPDATAAAFEAPGAAGPAWFRTGDVGRLSADGYLTLCGRMSDLIISGGFNIYPREIEDAVLGQPGVREAAVVGEPDATRGEVPVAYLVADEGFDEAALKERLRQELASFKLPRAFIRVDALPRTALGKVQRHLLPSAGHKPRST